QALGGRLHLAQGLAAYVAANPMADQQALDAYARGLFEVQPGIRNIAIAEGSVITYTYPREGNLETLGVDLATVPLQRASVRSALQGRQFVLDGPLELIQGGVGLVARHPITQPYEEPSLAGPVDGVGPSVVSSAGRSGPVGRVYGLSLVVFNHLSLMGEAGMLDTTVRPPVDWALRGAGGSGSHGEMFWSSGRPDLFAEDPEVLDVALPSGSWQLAVMPRGGWSTSSPTLIWVRVSGAVLALLLALLVYSLVRDPVRLREAVDRATASAVENARLYESARLGAERATLEERQRLARELHDSVTQTLFSASLIAEVLPRLWQRSPDVALPRLEELRQLTRGALAEMRTLLLELRPAVLIQMPLEDLLRQLAEAANGRARLPVTVDREGEREALLPPDTQLALYRIAQEALNNAARHAGAARATIFLRWVPATDIEPERVQLRIRDDGRGFDPAAVVRAGHLGLDGMRERAAAIGATLVIHSAPGEGTHVTVEWRAPHERLDRQDRLEWQEQSTQSSLSTSSLDPAAAPAP
ncbi:MAG TPA: histidine kinase, partial [Chloroflexota bacterium]|nr:histidine kinase [Chloroflexota bacterium]